MGRGGGCRAAALNLEEQGSAEAGGGRACGAGWGCSGCGFACMIIGVAQKQAEREQVGQGVGVQGVRLWIHKNRGSAAAGGARAWGGVRLPGMQCRGLGDGFRVTEVEQSVWE